MPKRKNVVRLPSDEVQGEGSWVLVALLTVEEIRKIRKMFKDLKEKKESKEDTFEVTVGYLKSHVKEWNWVFENGKSMPQPKDDSSIVEKLTEPETDFLSKCVAGSEKDSKN